MFRSGGTTVNNILIHHMDGTMLGYHRPRKKMPVELKTLPVIATIRNPWDWYVSVYHHAINFGYPKGANSFLNWLVDFRRVSFKEAMHYLLQIKVPPREKTLAYFPSTYEWNATKLDNLTKEDYINFCDSGLSFWSWLVEHMYALQGSVDGILWCKTSALHCDFYTLLEPFISKEKHKIKELLCAQRLNAMTGYNSYMNKNVPIPRKKDYRDYYDDELREWVYLKDHKYIEYFGFEF